MFTSLTLFFLDLIFKVRVKATVEEAWSLAQLQGEGWRSELKGQGQGGWRARWK